MVCHGFVGVCCCLQYFIFGLFVCLSVMVVIHNTSLFGIVLVALNCRKDLRYNCNFSFERLYCNDKSI